MKPKCEDCGAINDTVRQRNCGYEEEICNKSYPEVVCDECEIQHLAEI